MPVVINGTTGISGVDGSAGTPAFQGSDANTGIRFGTDIVSLVTGGSDRLYIDSSGRVGVGTSSPGDRLHVVGPAAGISARFSDGVNATVAISHPSSGTSKISDYGGNYGFEFASSSLNFLTAGSERMRIDSSGRVGIGTTSITNSVNVDIVSVIPPATDTYSKLQLRAGNYGYFLEGGLKQGIGSQLRFNITDDGSTKMMLDTGGRLLLGISSARDKFFGAIPLKVQIEGTETPDCSLAIVRNDTTADSSKLILAHARGTSYQIVSNNDAIGDISWQAADGSKFLQAANIRAFVDGTPGSDDMPGRIVFGTTADGSSAPTERMRITNNGNVFINASSNPAVGTEMFGVAAQGSGQTIAAGFANSVNTAPTVFISNGSNTTNTFLMRFSSGSGGNTRGEIYYNGSQLVYATSSDYRLKENIQPFGGGIEIVKQLRPVKYNWIENSNEDIGFIAHEVQEVFPNAVGGEKDAVDENGKILPQTYDPSKLVPLLTAALQEAISEIESLKARLTAAGI